MNNKFYKIYVTEIINDQVLYNYRFFFMIQNNEYYA